jgi:hypothetical protein
MQQRNSSTKKQVKKMLDLTLLLWAFWFIFGAYSFWFFSKAKTIQPLALDDLALIWKLHKQQTGCTAPSILSLLAKNNKIVGFKCNCGYEFLQKRLITQKIQKNGHPNMIAHAQKARQSLLNLGINYSYIREI